MMHCDVFFDRPLQRCRKLPALAFVQMEPLWIHSSDRVYQLRVTCR